MHAGVLLIGVLFSCAIPLDAQSWDGLRSLNPGDRVKVLDTSGQEQKAVFTNFSPDSIEITKGKNNLVIGRTRVRRVQQRTSSHRVRNVIIGTAIGLAIGLTVDYTLGTYLRNESGEDSGVRSITYIAPITLFGGIGAFLPAYRTVYRAP
jgi:hypothetical protein